MLKISDNSELVKNNIFLSIHHYRSRFPYFHSHH